MNEVEQEVQRWLRYAQEDLIGAESMIDQGSIRTWLHFRSGQLRHAIPAIGPKPRKRTP